MNLYSKVIPRQSPASKLVSEYDDFFGGMKILLK